MSQATTTNSSTRPLPPPGSELLALDNASKYFGTVIALEDVSMDLLAGEVHALLGLSLIHI